MLVEKNAKGMRVTWKMSNSRGRGSKIFVEKIGNRNPVRTKEAVAYWKKRRKEKLFGGKRR